MTAVEFIGAKYRTFCGIMIEVPFALGEAMTGVLAIFIRDWRWLQVAVTAPAFLLLSYMWCVERLRSMSHTYICIDTESDSDVVTVTDRQTQTDRAQHPNVVPLKPRL